MSGFDSVIPVNRYPNCVCLSACVYFVRGSILNKNYGITLIEIKNRLDDTYYFIVLLIGSIFFGHYYAHHQELATMMLITTLVVSFLACCMLEVRCG